MLNLEYSSRQMMTNDNGPLDYNAYDRFASTGIAFAKRMPSLFLAFKPF